MKIAHWSLNIVATLVIAAGIVGWLYLCRSTVTCVPDHQFVLVATLGVPVAAHLLSSAVALLAPRGRVQPTLFLLGLAAGAVALFTTLIAFGYATLFSLQAENAVPVLLYGGLAILALVPAATAANVIVLFSVLRAALSGPRSNAA